MAKGDIARTYRSAWLTTSSSPRWLVLHPRASELLAIFITVPSYTGYVERSVNRTSLGPRLGRGGAGLGGAIDVDERRLGTLKSSGPMSDERLILYEHPWGQHGNGSSTRIHLGSMHAHLYSISDER